MARTVINRDVSHTGDSMPSTRLDGVGASGFRNRAPSRLTETRGGAELICVYAVKSGIDARLGKTQWVLKDGSTKVEAAG